MGVEYLAVLATIAAALVGAASGYLGAFIQTRELRRTKRDEIAQALTEMEIERLQQRGVSSDYNPIAHYVVLRELLEEYGSSKRGTSIEALRDRYQDIYLSACETVVAQSFDHSGLNLTEELQKSALSRSSVYQEQQLQQTPTEGEIDVDNLQQKIEHK